MLNRSNDDDCQTGDADKQLLAAITMVCNSYRNN